ncbi:MAG TPA: hypothetical protein VD833_18890 [Vicinamibacterales bacterium]|nr:hypothetical protein [Vicinamibacterales bacterium]
MRSPLWAVIVSAVLPAGSDLTAQTTGAAIVRASFAERTAIQVSAPVLAFQVSDPADAAYAEIDFVAAARTSPQASVRLLVETRRAVAGPGGAGDAETQLSLEGGSEGVRTGEVSSSSSFVAAEWVGSGRRTGRLVFALRATAPGTYTVPLKVTVSAR